jgi:hypothetical protein
MVASKLEPSMQVMCLHRIDKKATQKYAEGEHVALTMSMNKSHLLMDVGKTIVSTFLAPGDEADSIPMIQCWFLCSFSGTTLMPYL